MWRLSYAGTVPERKYGGISLFAMFEGEILAVFRFWSLKLLDSPKKCQIFARECLVKRKYPFVSLVQLVSKDTISRVKRGLYKIAEKPLFSYEVKEETIQLYELLKDVFPYAPFCVYDGECLSPLQHHLSYNALTYVETDRTVAEAVFHTLQEKRVQGCLRMRSTCSQ